MRAITRRHLRVLNSDDYLPIEMLDVRLIGTTEASTIRITNAGESITWDSNVYTPLSMAHGDVEEILASDSGSVPAVTITVQNIDLQMAAMLQGHEIEGAAVTLWQTDRRLLDNPRDAIIITRGEIRDVQLTEQTLIFQVYNVIGLTEKLTVPRRQFQAECNYRFGSRSCTVDITQRPFSVIGTSLSGTNQNFVVVDQSVFDEAIGGDGSPAAANDFWAGGYVMFTDGPAAGQAQPIQESDARTLRFNMRRPFLVNPGVGSGFLVRRGCRKTKEDCMDRQDDGTAANFGGFEGVPYGRVIPSTKKVADYDDPG